MLEMVSCIEEDSCILLIYFLFFCKCHHSCKPFLLWREDFYLWPSEKKNVKNRIVLSLLKLTYKTYRIHCIPNFALRDPQCWKVGRNVLHSYRLLEVATVPLVNLVASVLYYSNVPTSIEYRPWLRNKEKLALSTSDIYIN